MNLLQDSLKLQIPFLLCSVLLPTIVHGQDKTEKEPYSRYAGHQFPDNVYFGDTHHHTANSGDAFMGGNRLTPEQAYRFALGEEVVSSTGIPARLSRPLDFLVISDHAEGLGVMVEVLEENPEFMKDSTLQRWSKAMKAGGKEAAAVQGEVVQRQSEGTLPAPINDPKARSMEFCSATDWFLK